MTDSFLEKEERYCKENKLLPRGGTVLAAVSGGCDSMCLLHSLVELSGKFGFSVAAAHFNHMLRGDESDRDERFVTEYCKNLGIPCYTGRGDVHAEAAQRRRGIEETARSMRYAFLERVCSQRGFLRIATAHSADDNVETVLINLARGAGLAGISGIPPRRGNVIRPLLFATRAEIELFLNENDIPHVEDSTNADDDYTRNKLRHHVIPALREINPRLSETVLKTCELAGMDDRYLSGLAEDFIKSSITSYGKIPVKALSALSYPVASRVIRHLIPGLSKKHVDTVLSLCSGENPSAEADLPGMTVRREYDFIALGKTDRASFSPFEIHPGETIEIPESKLRIICKKTVFYPNIHNSFNNFVLKYDSIQGAIVVRPRQSGDKISLVNRGGTKSLKKLYIDSRIPSAKRGLVPVIADSTGVIAVYGFGIDKRFKATCGETVLNIIIEEII